MGGGRRPVVLRVRCIGGGGGGGGGGVGFGCPAGRLVYIAAKQGRALPRQKNGEKSLLRQQKWLDFLPRQESEWNWVEWASV